MAIKFEFDWKNFFLQKGEKIGLGVGAVVLVLMAIVGLKDAFSASPGTNAENLKKLTAKANDLIKNNKPRDMKVFDVPEDLNEKTAGDLPPIAPDEYRAVAALYSPFAPEDAKRRDPKIEQPTELVAFVVRGQIEAHMFTPDGREVMTLHGGGDKSQNKDAQGRLQMGMGMLGGNMGMMGGPGMTGGNIGGGPGRGIQQPGTGAGLGGGRGGPAGVGVVPGRQGLGTGPAGGGVRGRTTNLANATQLQKEQGIAYGEGGPKEKGFVKITELQDRDVRLADKVLPLRMVIVEGSFPYRKQLEDIMAALHLRTLAEAAAELEFDGFEVQRCEVGPDGKASAWGEVGDKGFITHLLEVARATGQRFADEDPALDPMILDGLVTPLPKQFENRSYPKPDLKDIEETKKVIAAKGAPPAAPPSSTKFDVDTNRVFRRSASSSQSAGSDTGGTKPQVTTPKSTGTAVKPGVVTTKETPAGGGAKGPKPVSPTEGAKAGPTTLSADWEPPEYCLLRFFDPTAEAGKTYKYQFKIKIVNPNKGKDKSVAYKELAEKAYVISNWIEVPQAVSIPPDFRFYAVNVKELTPKDMPDEKANTYNTGAYRISRDSNEVAVQLQRWVDDLDLTGIKEPVGDWAVAEQVFFHRGEFIGGPQRIRLPVWSWANEEFVIATHPNDRRQKQAWVPFTESDSQCPLLVDFSGGTVSYNKPDETRRVVVEDKDIPRELLLLSPEGRLYVRNSFDDAADAERKEHVKGWRDRLKEIDERKAGPRKPGSADVKEGADPFKPKTKQ
jgi:hypothetical protein